jgi:hypothetical protein
MCGVGCVAVLSFIATAFNNIRRERERESGNYHFKDVNAACYLMFLSKIASLEAGRKSK